MADDDELSWWAGLSAKATPGPWRTNADLRPRGMHIVLTSAGESLAWMCAASSRASDPLVPEGNADATLIATDRTVRDAVVAVVQAAAELASYDFVWVLRHGGSGQQDEVDADADNLDRAIGQLLVELRRAREGT